MAETLDPAPATGGPGATTARPARQCVAGAREDLRAAPSARDGAS
ncbi:hypothetical protein [Cellulomonas sp. NS3]|nr:hypothetical protein [Cellulomonas sp. NS3]